MDLIELEIVFADPAESAENQSEDPCQDGGKHKADEQKSCPVGCGNRGFGSCGNVVQSVGVEICRAVFENEHGFLK